MATTVLFRAQSVAEGLWEIVVPPRKTRWGLIAGIGAGVVSCAAGVGYLYYRRQIRQLSAVDRIVASSEGFLAQGMSYDPPLRDACEGEQADICVEEEVVVADGPATRRLAKKKYAHQTMASGVLNTGYLADVVQQARLQYCHRAATAYNMALAKGYMVRLMTEHGVRPAHIASCIDRMVVAVFVVTSDQLEARETAAVLRAAGRFGGDALI